MKNKTKVKKHRKYLAHVEYLRRMRRLNAIAVSVMEAMENDERYKYVTSSNLHGRKLFFQEIYNLV